jgi:hypothetical protein
MAAGDKLTTAASVERVNAWRQHHVGPRPPFRDDKADYRTMRLGRSRTGPGGELPSSSAVV